MTVFWGIVAVVLKGIGILLLVLLALAVLFLLLPIGVRMRYEAGKYNVTACIGPLRFSVLGGKKKSKAEKPKEGSPPAQPPPDKAEEPGQGGTLPAFLQRRADAVVALAKSDPAALAERALCHGGWLFNRLLRGLRVRHLTVFWPIIGEDAADTALRYGAAITAANNLLLLLRRRMKIQADSLQMEADFTAEHTARRLVAADVKTNLATLLVIGLRMVHRIWVDPALRPAAKAA